jgi:hypothetical protein
VQAIVKATENRQWYALSVLFLVGICSTLCFLLRKNSQDKVVGSRHLIKENPYFVPLKIGGFSSANIPYLKMNIENKALIAEIDLGCDEEICLPSEIIKELRTKKFIKRNRSYGFRGKTYESDVYRVEEVNIETMSFFPVKAEEINLEFEHDGNLGEKKETSTYDLGRVGWCLFRNFNLLVDSKHSTLALCDSLETLRKQGYPVNSFTEASLLLDSGFIEFEATTEAGMLRCMLDTGCTLNMLNKDLEEGASNDHRIFTSGKGDQSFLNPENKNLLTFDSTDVQELSAFNIGGKDFGPITFNRIKSPVPIDAIIGMEFFFSNLVFIDFFNCKLYIFEYPSEEKVLITLDEVKKIQAIFN